MKEARHETQRGQKLAVRGFIHETLFALLVDIESQEWWQRGTKSHLNIQNIIIYTISLQMTWNVWGIYLLFYELNITVLLLCDIGYRNCQLHDFATHLGWDRGTFSIPYTCSIVDFIWRQSLYVTVTYELSWTVFLLCSCPHQLYSQPPNACTRLAIVSMLVSHPQCLHSPTISLHASLHTSCARDL